MPSMDSGAPTDAPTARNAAEERVLQFGRDFDEQWRKAKPIFDDRSSGSRRNAFALWRELLAEALSRHFVAGAADDFSTSFSSPPHYGPQVETLIGSEIDGDTARVQTRGRPPLEPIHEYLLTAQDGDWRIASLEEYHGDPAEPFVDPETVQERLAATSATAAFETMPAAQRAFDEVHNFTEREVTGLREGASSQVTRSLVGTLVTTSGVLAVLDGGYDNSSAKPLERTVPPGYYPVDRVVVDGRNAAVRVTFSPEAPTRWRPASIPGGGHVFGVDAGSACLVDYPAYAAQTRRDKAAMWRRFTEAEGPGAIEAPLPEGNRGIVVASGIGDGAYPVYWGIAADGAVVQLVVDFLMLVKTGEDGVMRHL